MYSNTKILLMIIIEVLNMINVMAKKALIPIMKVEKSIESSGALNCNLVKTSNFSEVDCSLSKSW